MALSIGGKKMFEKVISYIFILLILTVLALPLIYVIIKGINTIRSII